MLTFNAFLLIYSGKQPGLSDTNSIPVNVQVEGRFAANNAAG